MTLNPDLYDEEMETNAQLEELEKAERELEKEEREINEQESKKIANFDDVSDDQKTPVYEFNGSSINKPLPINEPFLLPVFDSPGEEEQEEGEGEEEQEEQEEEQEEERQISTNNQVDSNDEKTSLLLSENIEESDPYFHTDQNATYKILKRKVINFTEKKDFGSTPRIQNYVTLKDYVKFRDSDLKMHLLEPSNAAKMKHLKETPFDEECGCYQMKCSTKQANDLFTLINYSTCAIYADKEVLWNLCLFYGFSYDRHKSLIASRNKSEYLSVTIPITHGINIDHNISYTLPKPTILNEVKPTHLLSSRKWFVQYTITNTTAATIHYTVGSKGKDNNILNAAPDTVAALTQKPSVVTSKENSDYNNEIVSLTIDNIAFNNINYIADNIFITYGNDQTEGRIKVLDEPKKDGAFTISYSILWI